MPNVHGQPQPGELVTLNDGTTAEVKSYMRAVPRDSAHMVELRKPCRQEFAKVRSYTHADGWREMVPEHTFEAAGTISADQIAAGVVYVRDPIAIMEEEPERDRPSHWVAFKSVLPWLLAGMVLGSGAMLLLEWLARG